VNFLQLCQRAVVECGVSGYAANSPTTTVGQTGQLARIINWVNSAWVDIQSIHQDWQWLRYSCAFPTVTGQALYTTAQCNTTDFGMWARDTYRNYANPVVSMTIASPCVVTLASHGLSNGDRVNFFTSDSLPTGVIQGQAYYVLTVTANTFTFSQTLNGTPVNSSGTQSGVQTMTSGNTTTFIGMASEIFMDYEPYDEWRDTYQFGGFRYAYSRPINFSYSPDFSICLGPVPISGYTIIGDYYKVATELSADADTPNLPSQFHQAIVYRAMMFYGMSEAAPEVFQEGETEFKRMMARISMHELNQVQIAGALV